MLRPLRFVGRIFLLSFVSHVKALSAFGSSFALLPPLLISDQYSGSLLPPTVNPQTGYKCHCQVRMDNVSCVVVCDQEYPPRVAYSLAAQVMDDFQKKYPPSVWVKAQIGSMYNTRM